MIAQCQQEIQDSTDEAVIQAKKQQIAGWQDYINPLKITGHALDALVNDVFIREKMKDDTAQNAFLHEFGGKGRALTALKHFQDNQVSDYEGFLKSNRLSSDDVEKVLEMNIRLKFFKKYFEELQKPVPKNFIMPNSLFNRPMQLEDWLDKQRKEVTYEHSTNFEQRAQWLAEQLGWKR